MQFSKEEKAMWLEDWRRSGKGAWAYAKENGLVPQTFYKWTKAEKETKGGFVEVPMQIIPSAMNKTEILIEKGDVKIHIPPGMKCSDLRAVIEALGPVI